MAFVSLPLSPTNQAVRLSSVNHLRVDVQSPGWALIARLVDGGEITVSTHSTQADAQTALADWLVLLGKFDV